MIPDLTPLLSWLNIARESLDMRPKAALVALAATGEAAVAMAVPVQAAPAGSLSSVNGAVVVTYSGLGGFAYLNFCNAADYPYGTCQAVGRLYFATNNASSTLGASPFTIQEGATVKVGTSGTTTTALPSGTYRLDLYDSTGGGIVLDSIVATISNSAGSTVGPDPVVQQFGRPTVGTCAETALESLTWVGVSGGGWGESWAQWVNGGNGGSVCTRTLTYSSSQGRWTVG